MEAHTDQRNSNSVRAIYDAIIELYYGEFILSVADNLVPILPLAEYAVCAFEYNVRCMAVTDYAESHSELFPFTWALAGHSLLKNLEGDDAYAETDEAVAKKFGTESDALTVVFGFGDGEYEEFLATWDRITFPLGRSPLETALELAEEYPLDVGSKGRRERRLYQRFISVTGWGQAIRRDKPAFYPCREVAELLGCSPSQVSAMRRSAEKDGFLTVLNLHTYVPGGKGRATEYSFDLARFPGLLDESARDVVPLPQAHNKNVDGSNARDAETAHRILRLTGQSEAQDDQDSQRQVGSPRTSD